MKGNIQKLMDVLSNQNMDGVISGDWDQIKPEFKVIDKEENPRASGSFEVRLDSEEINFIFDEDENLVGICNWKE